VLEEERVAVEDVVDALVNVGVLGRAPIAVVVFRERRQVVHGLAQFRDLGGVDGLGEVGVAIVYYSRNPAFEVGVGDQRQWFGHWGSGWWSGGGPIILPKERMGEVPNVLVVPCCGGCRLHGGPLFGSRSTPPNGLSRESRGGGRWLG